MTGTNQSKSAADKQTLRNQAIELRHGIDDKTRTRAASAIAKAGCALAGRTGAKSVAVFHAVRGEIDCLELCRVLNEAGLETSLPVMAPDSLILQFHPWQAGAPVERGAFGVPVPRMRVAECRPDLVFVPLLRFDRRGWRLGYGGGYYDATLRDLRQSDGVIAAGVGFALQEIGHVPHDAHDEPVDWIITECETIAIGKHE
jgi:5-formyltetrahydrofolate cyclo-ligase